VDLARPLNSIIGFPGLAARSTRSTILLCAVVHITSMKRCWILGRHTWLDFGGESRRKRQGCCFRRATDLVEIGR
jgi:hypothetical protein